MTEIPTITIDMDKKCTACGHKGVGENGLCLRCATNKNLRKVLGGNLTMNIGIIEKAKTEISGLLDNYAVQICKAYTQNEDDLTVSLSLNFSSVKAANTVKMQASIAFIESKVKDSVKVLIEEKQKTLFE